MSFRIHVELCGGSKTETALTQSYQPAPFSYSDIAAGYLVSTALWT